MASTTIIFSPSPRKCQEISFNHNLSDSFYEVPFAPPPPPHPLMKTVSYVSSKLSDNSRGRSPHKKDKAQELREAMDYLKARVAKRL
jgi:hypothetical protein